MKKCLWCKREAAPARSLCHAHLRLHRRHRRRAYPADYWRNHTPKQPCGVCFELGHNRRRCPELKSQYGAQHLRGAELRTEGT